MQHSIVLLSLSVCRRPLSQLNMLLPYVALHWLLLPHLVLLCHKVHYRVQASHCACTMNATEKSGYRLIVALSSMFAFVYAVC